MSIFKGKNILITGASCGIGQAFAKKLAEEGANLILVARSFDRLSLVKEELERNSRVNIYVYKADLSKPDGPIRLYDQVKNDGLCVDILINNAGSGIQAGRL